ncbi:hypothetical protein [Pseudonocardia xishanensis]|uniref:Uncharacterized protein n=1 Tax=Pseudonocardia xishanensis TaxID=630995 RepID=A0ABP8RRY1_9PSEU
MSTSLDGSPPSADPGDPGDADRTDPPGGPRRRRAPGNEDSGPLWLQEEMRRRMEDRARNPRGRHARDEADTEQFGVDALTARLRSGGPRSAQPPGPPRPGLTPSVPPAVPSGPGVPPGAAQGPGPGWSPVQAQSPGRAQPPVEAPVHAQSPVQPQSPVQLQSPVQPQSPVQSQHQAQAPPYSGPAPQVDLAQARVQTLGAPTYQDFAPQEGPARPRPYGPDAPAAGPLAGTPAVPDVDPAATHPESGPPQDYLDYDDYDDDYDDYDEDEDDATVVDDGDPAPFERVLGPASVPLRLPAPEAYVGSRDGGPQPGPGGMRQLGGPMERAGRRAPAPDTLGGPLRGPDADSTVVPTTPTGVPGPSSWPEHAPEGGPGADDPERTDIGVLAPVQDDPATRLPLSARTAAAPAPTVAPTTEAPVDQPELGRPVGARFDRILDAEESTEAPRRVRVVLSERKGVARTVRTVVDVQEGTAVGELLRANLIRGQLAVALRVGVVALLVLGLMPMLFAFYPEVGRMEVLGLRLPWLLLGVLVYPFLLGLGWWHTKAAEKVEQNFADHVQD